MYPSNSLIFKSPINNFMRGSRSAEQANETYATGHHRKESTATAGQPFSINRVHVVLFLPLRKLKALSNGPRFLLNGICGPLFIVLRN